MKKLILLLAVATSATLPVLARETMSLDGDWHYIIDPQEIGFYSYHNDRQREDGRFGRNEKPKDRTELLEYSFADAPTLRVPGDWNTQKPELLWYEGTVWYEREFEVRSEELGVRSCSDGEETPNSSLLTPNCAKRFLVFDAVNYEAHVYVNGTKVGKHEGGFSPFEFEVTDLLRDGTNCVVVKVDNRRRRDAIPTLGYDWWNYGGIIRDVRLESRPATYIADWRVDLAKGDDLTQRRRGAESLVARVQLDKAIAGVPVKVEIPEAGITMAGETDENGRVAVLGRRNPGARGRAPSLWSPENPKLYEVVVTAGEDRVSDEMGFRTIETKGKQILLNGEPVFLRGVCLHDEAPNGGGRVTTDEEVAENIRRAKALGCNYVRLAHYPHNERMVRACERAGLMVWSEIPLYWMIDWTNTNTYARAEAQARDMIRRDIRRACVIIWSLANETPQTRARTDFLARLARYARACDPSRLISAAMQVYEAKNYVNRLDDELSDVVDIVAFNEYVGWYRDVGDADKMTWEIPYDKPVVISEFGGGAVAGRHGEKDERWTEEMQEDIYRANLRMLEKIDGLAGLSPWVLTDFRSPRRPLAGVQDGYNRKGLFAPDGRTKKAFHVMRDFYERKAKEKN